MTREEAIRLGSVHARALLEAIDANSGCRHMLNEFAVVVAAEVIRRRWEERRSQRCADDAAREQAKAESDATVSAIVEGLGR